MKPPHPATPAPATPADTFSTIEVARLLGLSVRSVQLMVDRGELDAWKTPGGHRRVSRVSVQRWREANGHRPPAAGDGRASATDDAPAPPRSVALAPSSPARPSVLLIDDSVHFQKLVSMLFAQHFPHVELQVADDGISGLALYGQWQPQVLIVDILLPGIDGATLITSLRSHPQFAHSRLAVVTSLDEKQREPYAFALENVPVIHKPRLVAELPGLLAAWLPPAPPAPPVRARGGAAAATQKV